LEAEQRGVIGGDEKKRQRSAGMGKGMTLTGRPHMAVTWEREGVSAGVRNVEENTPFRKYANAGWVDWAERGTGSLRGRAGQRGVGLGRMGRNPKKIPFWIKIKFLNIPRLWKFARGDLGGILTWGFFLNSSRLLKYFRKMKYATPRYATLGKN
jgi:hypothetical protein